MVKASSLILFFSSMLSNRLKTYRKRSHLSQQEISFLLGLKDGSEISRYERGTRIPALPTALTYSLLFTVPTEQLFHGTFITTRKEIKKRIRQLIDKLSEQPSTLGYKAKIEYLQKQLAIMEQPLQKHQHKLPKRILGIDPAIRGFGFAVLEESGQLLDWGVTGCREDRGAECLGKVEEIIEYYQPDVIALENCKGPGSRRCHAVQLFIRHIIRHAGKKKIKIQTFSPEEIKKAFSQEGATKKQEIAEVIARRFPELTPRLPKPRKGEGESEDYRMAIFDAVGLGIVAAQSKQ